MPIANTRTVELNFKGHGYKHVAVDRIQGDPSWWSFIDEGAVREEFWNIQPGDQVFDIGAAYGSYTVTALAMGASHVFAWSPQGHPGSEERGEKEADFLRETLALNGWSSRCSIFEEGLYDKTGFLNADTQQFALTREDVAGKPGDIIPVRPFGDWMDVEYFAKGFRPTDRIWVKIDTEGAEPQILKALLSPLIMPCGPRLLIENHNFKRATLEQEVREMVTAWGYREVATRPYHSVSHSFYEI